MYCAACKKHVYDYHESLSFHRLPQKDDLKKIWILHLHLDENVAKSSRICSNHFVTEDFEYRVSRKYLKKNAVPKPLHFNKPCTSNLDFMNYSSDLSIKLEGSNDETENMETKFSIERLAEVENKVEEHHFIKNVLPKPLYLDKPSTSNLDIMNYSSDLIIKSEVSNSETVNNETQPFFEKQAEADNKLTSSNFKENYLKKNAVPKTLYLDKPSILKLDFMNSFDSSSKAEGSNKETKISFEKRSEAENLLTSSNLDEYERCCIFSQTNYETSSSTSTASETELHQEMSKEFYFKKIKEPQFVHTILPVRRPHVDGSSSDLSSDLSYSCIKKRLLIKTRKVRCLQQKVRRLKKKVAALTSLLNILKEKKD